MALPNDSVQKLQDGSGTLIATQLVGTKEYEVDMVAGPAGHILGSRESYLVLATPSVSGAANFVWFDMFNAAGSGKTIELHGVWFNSNLDVAAAAALGYRFDFFRTTTSGSGGNVFASATLPRSLSRIDAVTGNLPSQITMRDRPTGAAAVSTFIGQTFYFSEEAATSQSYVVQFQNALRYSVYTDMADLPVPAGSGFKIVQGPVLTIGLIGYRIAFSVY